MRVISPYEFRNEFPPGEGLAIVGNARSLLDWEFGSNIDKHSVVVRFNESTVEGFEKHVGARTDILVTNPYAETRPGKRLADHCCRCVIVITPQVPRGDKKIFEEWVGDNKVLFTYTPSLIGVENPDHQAGLTTGTYAIQLLGRILRPRKLLLTGFTMFAEATDSHYFKSGVPSGVRFHDLPTEAGVFCRIVNGLQAETATTPDVSSIFARVGEQRAPHVRPLSVSKNLLSE
jgi:hypothetical protein